MPLITERLDSLEKIVRPQLFDQYKEEFKKVAQEQIASMNEVKADFEATMGKGMKAMAKAEKWVGAAGKFDNVMEDFQGFIEVRLDAANDRIAKAHDTANDIEAWMREIEDKMKGNTENWEAEAGIRDIKDKMVNMEKEIENLATEAGIRDINIKMEKMEKDIENLGTKIMHVAIEQANSAPPTPRGRQTSRQRSASLQIASGILKGFTAPIDDEADEAEGPHQQKVPRQPALLPLTCVRSNMNPHSNNTSVD